MKKILLLSLLIFILLAGNAFGAVSDDMSGYMRQAERDKTFMVEMKLEIGEFRREMNERFNALDKKIDNVHATLDKKIDNVRSDLREEILKVNAKVDVINERTESTKTMVYWILGMLAVIVGLPSVQRFLQWREESKEKREPLLTNVEIEALRRLLEINNVKAS